MADIKKIRIDGVEYELGGGGNSLLVVENTAEAIEEAGGFEHLLNTYKLIGFEVKAYGARRSLPFQRITWEDDAPYDVDFNYFITQNSNDNVATTFVSVTVGTDYDVATIETVQFIIRNTDLDENLIGYEDDNHVINILFM